MSLNSNSRTLRAIGQALEEQHLEDFDLKNQNGDFVVRGRQALPEGGEKLIRDILTRLRREPGGFVELHYTQDDIDRLEDKGRSRRRDNGGMPDFYALSQMLRTVGAYVDQKQADVLELSRDGPRLTIQYKLGEGQLTIEAHELTSLYKFFAEMYLHRGFDSPSGTVS